MKGLTGKWPRLIDAVVSVLFAALIAIVRVLPRRGFMSLASLLSAVLWPLASARVHRTLERNVARILGLSPGSPAALRFERQLVHHQVVCALETLRAIYQPELIEVDGLEELENLARKAESEGDGPIFITGHLGSWELAAHYSHLAGKRPLLVLAKPARLPSVTRVLTSLRERLGARVLTTERALVLRDALRALRAGEALGLVADQRPDRGRGPRVGFFGVPTAFVGGPAALSIRTRAAIISIFCIREGPFRYRLICRELAPANHEETDVVTLTQRMADEIERVIRSHPEQWNWMYRRWSFRAEV